MLVCEACCACACVRQPLVVQKAAPALAKRQAVESRRRPVAEKLLHNTAALWDSLMVMRRAWMAHRLQSSNRCTIKSSVACIGCEYLIVCTWFAGWAPLLQTPPS